MGLTSNELLSLPPLCLSLDDIAARHMDSRRNDDSEDSGNFGDVPYLPGRSVSPASDIAITVSLKREQGQLKVEMVETSYVMLSGVERWLAHGFMNNGKPVVELSGREKTIKRQVAVYVKGTNNPALAASEAIALAARQYNANYGQGMPQATLALLGDMVFSQHMRLYRL